MPRLRTRLLALTCAVAAATTGLSAAVIPAAGAGANSAVPTTSTGKAIVTFPAVPTAAQVQALRSLGLTVQPMTQLPMALVAGPVDLLDDAASVGLDVYPDERLQYSDTASTNAMSSSVAAAEQLRASGRTGEGVTVGVVDSGCDATHPDLADQVTHNVTLISPEYVNQETTPVLVIPADQGPYSNTDLGSGHGTHVAGIIAADGTSGPEYLGVAPDAELACFAIGAVITTTAVVTAYDYALSQPDMLGIDVFNNSWGNSFRQYDPNDPVNVATKAVTDRGAVVVFAAGNSGHENGEASVSPFNQAPWVISVAAGSVARERGYFSSNGLEFDNGAAVPIGPNGHTVFTGDRIGNTQPDLMAPGVGISSSCSSTGTVIGPCPEHGNDTAQGTSMASPHVAGAAAVLIGARPEITPMQVQQALTATATPVAGADGDLASSQVGYGHPNLDEAVDLVTSAGWKKNIITAQRAADRRLLAQDPWKVARSDLWQEAAPPIAAGGSYAATRTIAVGRGVEALKIALVYPSTGIVGGNFASFVATVKDASGTVVDTTETNLLYSVGLAHVLVEGVERGEAYTIEVTGEYAVSDPDTIDSDSINGRVVFLQAAQLAPR